jgi:hypothetical protein
LSTFEKESSPLSLFGVSGLKIGGRSGEFHLFAKALLKHHTVFFFVAHLVNLVVCKQPKSVLQGVFGCIAKILTLGCTSTASTFAVLFFVLFHMAKIHVIEQC